MIQVTINRTYYDKCTPGKLTVAEKGFQCCTVELPWRENKPGESCIPAGLYSCEWAFSATLGWGYRITGVTGRAGIRIHAGNFTRQIKGCILLGREHKDIDKDGITDVTESKKTIKEFEKLLNKQPFKLLII